MNYKILVLEKYPNAVCLRLTYHTNGFHDVRRTYHVKDEHDGKDISGEHSTSRGAWESAFKKEDNESIGI